MSKLTTALPEINPNQLPLLERLLLEVIGPDAKRSKKPTRDDIFAFFLNERLEEQRARLARLLGRQ